MKRLTIRTDICAEPENDIIYSNPNDPNGMYNILDLASLSDAGDGTEAGILLNISYRLAEYEDTGLSPAEVAELAQAKAVKHGKWVLIGTNSHDYETSIEEKCSICGRYVYRYDTQPQDNYCPNCGARMDSEK